MKPFQLLIKPVSSACNLRCKYCFYLKTASLYPSSTRSLMSDATLERVISQYLQFGFKESIFCWQGGEPTLAGLNFYKNVVELQKKCGTSGQVVGNALQTNGVLIDDEWSQFLSNYKFLVGLSLDGPKSVHDRFRKTAGGKSVWDKVMAAAASFKRHGVEYNILCVVSKANINSAKKIYDFFIDNGFHDLQFVPALEFDERNQLASYCVTPAQYGRFLCELWETWSVNPSLASIRTFNAVLSHYMGLPSLECTYDKCCADYLLIEWNGNVYPCDFFVQREWLLGNTNSDTFSDLRLKRDNGFAMLKQTLSSECAQCKWMELCHGGCVKDRLPLPGFDRNKTYFCESYKSFFNFSNEWFLDYCKKLK